MYNAHIICKEGSLMETPNYTIELTTVYASNTCSILTLEYAQCDHDLHQLYCYTRSFFILAVDH